MNKPRKTVIQYLILAVATGLGLGLMPVASGTFGSLLGIPLVIWLSKQPLVVQIVVAQLLAILAIPICHAAEKILGGRKDDGRIVADEWMLLPIAAIGLPVSKHPWLLIPVFLVARLCDIIKPPPARGLQKLNGGLGIVIDDYIAAWYALGVNWVIWLVWQGAAG